MALIVFCVSCCCACCCCCCVSSAFVTFVMVSCMLSICCWCLLNLSSVGAPTPLLVLLFVVPSVVCLLCVVAHVVHGSCCSHGSVVPCVCGFFCDTLPASNGVLSSCLLFCSGFMMTACPFHVWNCGHCQLLSVIPRSHTLAASALSALPGMLRCLIHVSTLSCDVPSGIGCAFTSCSTGSKDYWAMR